MASVIFAGQPIGAIVLPLMLFHQIQLMACAVIAQKYADAAKPRHRTQAKQKPERLQDSCRRNDTGLIRSSWRQNTEKAAPTRSAAFVVMDVDSVS